MSGAQKQNYQEFVQMHSSDSGVVRASNEGSGIGIMMDMRKIANHPLLMRTHYSDKTLMKIAHMLSTHPLYKKNPHPPYIFEELAILSDFQVQQLLEKFVSVVGISSRKNFVAVFFFYLFLANPSHIICRTYKKWTYPTT